MVAFELGLELDLVPVHDITSADAAVYAGNPARKMPTLRRPSGALVFGAENICRALEDLAVAQNKPSRVVWPEALRSDVSRNAQELVWHGMAAQVQLVFGTIVGKLPSDNVYFAKGRVGFEGALEWLNLNLTEVLQSLPAARDVSLFEVTLFCLLDHLVFRGTLPVAPYPALMAFATSYGQRAAARHTVYRFDTAPA